MSRVEVSLTGRLKAYLDELAKDGRSKAEILRGALAFQRRYEQALQAPAMATPSLQRNYEQARQQATNQPWPALQPPF